MPDSALDKFAFLAKFNLASALITKIHQNTETYLYYIINENNFFVHKEETEWKNLHIFLENYYYFNHKIKRTNCLKYNIKKLVIKAKDLLLTKC